MKVSFAGQTFDCTRAVRSSDTATLYLTEGGTVEFCGVNNWEAFSLTGGDWSLPDVTETEQLRADVDFLAIMTGVML